MLHKFPADFRISLDACQTNPDDGVPTDAANPAQADTNDLSPEISTLLYRRRCYCLCARRGTTRAACERRPRACKRSYREFSRNRVYER